MKLAGCFNGTKTSEPKDPGKFDFSWHHPFKYKYVLFKIASIV